MIKNTQTKNTNILKQVIINHENCFYDSDENLFLTNYFLCLKNTVKNWYSY